MLATSPESDDRGSRCGCCHKYFAAARFHVERQNTRQLSPALAVPHRDRASGKGLRRGARSLRCGASPLPSPTGEDGRADNSFLKPPSHSHPPEWGQVPPTAYAVVQGIALQTSEPCRTPSARPQVKYAWQVFGGVHQAHEKYQAP